MTGAQKLVADFYGKDLLEFYKSSVDGTLCVAVREMGLYKTYEVLKLAKRIMKFKRELLAQKERLSK